VPGLTRLCDAERDGNRTDVPLPDFESANDLRRTRIYAPRVEGHWIPLDLSYTDAACSAMALT
jgi:hypothetical protein